MDREQRAAMAEPQAEKIAGPSKEKSSNTQTTTPAAPRVRWVRNLADYDRREPRELQVSRFG
jgi:hypothetical protein